MDEIIDREQRGEASPAELEQLTEWRRASIANEHEYRRLVRMLGVTRTLVSSLRAAPPSAAAVLGRRRDDAPSSSASRARWMPWLIAAGAAMTLRRRRPRALDGYRGSSRSEPRRRAWSRALSSHERTLQRHRGAWPTSRRAPLK